MKLSIDHLTGSKSGATERFERESILIGRGSANDVVLDPFLDPTVSAQHAEIRIERNRIVLYDMGSLNGTFLNGFAVRRAELKKGDEISLGRTGPRLKLSLGRNGRGAVAEPSSPDTSAAEKLDKTAAEPIAIVDGGFPPAPGRSWSWLAWLGAALAVAAGVFWFLS